MTRDEIEKIRAAAAATDSPFRASLTVVLPDSAVSLMLAAARVCGLDADAILRVALDEYLARHVMPSPIAAMLYVEAEEAEERADAEERGDVAPMPVQRARRLSPPLSSDVDSDQNGYRQS